ncbi:short-chain dehydrogenase reductase 3b-like [Punica granatum]|uniref:Uncharacterized protein n=2 Tax=Punica granatum TaxID=22663 RepID=A0A2I0HQP6_PUNGR|nr:short-chain dehydrogenase reductase 3b-like [Punica granatum]PKI34028.1 hypothetical protein CRG98_045588 [Punica granatum]
MYSTAGIMGPLASITDMDIDVYNCTLAVNLRGSALAIKHAARAMVASKTRSSIVCTGSVLSIPAGMRHNPYTVSKHGLLGLVRSAASELGAFGIRANCISPYRLAAPMACGLMNLEPAVVEAMSDLKGITLKVD